MDATLARLERIPLGRPHRRLLFQGGLGYLFDAADGAVIAFLLPVVTAMWHLSPGQTGLLASSGLWGFAAGAIIAGQLADRIGRKNVMMYAMLFYAVFTVVAAFAGSWGVFFWCRVIAGVGLGAESAVIAPFLSEFVPSRYRGKYIGTLTVFFAFGFIAAALVSRKVVPIHDFLGLDGWQLIQIITALPVLLLLVWRRVLPESPRFLLARGRHAEADAVVTKFEAEYEKRSGHELPPMTVPASETVALEHEATKKIGVVASILALFARGMARRTIIVCALWFVATFAFYGFNIWIFTLLVGKGWNTTHAFDAVLLFYIAQVPGYLSAALLNDRADRKWTSAGYLCGGVLATIFMASAASTGTVIASGMVLSFCLTGVYASLYTFTPEIYPTRIRTTGMSLSAAFGRVGGIIAPNVIPWVLTNHGFSGVFTMVGAVLFLGAVAVAVFGISTSGQTLEELNEAAQPQIAQLGRTAA